ncbi:MAG: hypothetical protein ACRDN0_06595 [Trebonia sp.]
MRLIGAVALIGAFLLLFSAEYEGAATVFNLVFGIGYVPAVLIAVAVAVAIGVLLAVRPVGAVGTIVIIVQQFMASTFAVALIAALNWRRATALGAAVSMCAGFAGVLVWYTLGDPFGLAPVYLGLPLSLLGMVVTSLVPGARPAPMVLPSRKPRSAHVRPGRVPAVPES